jgi:hypothetical protein
VSLSRPAKPSSSASLRKAIASLDATTAQVSTIDELRAWRLGMAKRFIGLSIMPTPPLANRGKK